MNQERLYASIDALPVLMYQARLSKPILRQLTHFLFLGYQERPNASIDAYPVSYVSRVKYASIDAFPVFMHKERSNVSIVAFHVPCVSRNTMCIN